MALRLEPRGLVKYCDDEELMRSVAAGVRPAQNAVLERIQKRVQGITVAILGRGEDAKDAAQISLMQVLRAANTFRGESRLETWASRIALNESVRLARERRLRSARNLSEDLAELLVSPSHPELRFSIPRRLHDYLRDMPENLRNPLILRYGLEYTLSEVAELTRTSPNTVKARLARARSQVRRMIARDMLRTTAPKPRNRSGTRTPPRPAR